MWRSPQEGCVKSPFRQALPSCHISAPKFCPERGGGGARGSTDLVHGSPLACPIIRTGMLVNRAREIMRSLCDGNLGLARF